MNNSNDGRPLFQSAWIVVVVLIAIGLALASAVRDERRKLKEEIAEWELAARPAIAARGWDSRYFESSGLDPQDLRNALDPCLNIGGRHLETDECDDIVEFWKNGQRHPAVIPIKIVIAR